MEVPTRATYRCDVVQKLTQEANNAVHIFVALDESKTLAPCQLADDVKGKVLEPLTEVAGGTRIGEQLFRPVEEVCKRRAYERLIADKRTHGESIVYASAVFCVEVFVGSTKERW